MRSITLVLLVAFLATPAHAQESHGNEGDRPNEQLEGSDEEARALFDAASIAYQEGRYESALDYFRRSYELSGRAALLFNIGMTAQQLRREGEALEAYRRYLQEEPDASNRSAVEARIAILEGGREEEEEEARPSAGPSSDSPAFSSGPSIASIALVVTGGVFAVSGGILLGIASSDALTVEGSARGTPWLGGIEQAYSRIEPLSISGGASLGVGVALAAVGVVLMLAVPEESSGAHAGAPLVWEF